VIMSRLSEILDDAYRFMWEPAKTLTAIMQHDHDTVCQCTGIHGTYMKRGDKVPRCSSCLKPVRIVIEGDKNAE